MSKKVRAIKVGDRYMRTSKPIKDMFTVGKVYEVIEVDATGEGLIVGDKGKAWISQRPLNTRWELIGEAGQEKKGRIYLAHPISNTYEAEYSIKVAEELRKYGFEVYAPAENKNINDKTTNPTPAMIYGDDMAELLKCDVLMVNVTGGEQDGTILEIGAIAMFNELAVERNLKVKPIFAFTTNQRLLNPQISDGIPSAKMNHLVKGAIDTWGKLYRSADHAIDAIAGVE